MSEGMSFDFFAREWEFMCTTCNKEFYTPTKKDMQRAILIHTRKECLGGW